MANVRNTFNITLGSVTIVEDKAFPGMTDDGGIVEDCFVTEATAAFQKAIYRTLLDAGYEATMNEEAYSVTVLGFTFFPLIHSTKVNAEYYTAYPYLYAYGHDEYLSGGNVQAKCLNNGSGGMNLNFSIHVRGDENSVAITFGGYDDIDRNYLLLLVSRATNMVDQSKWYFYTCAYQTANNANYCYYRSEADVYTVYQENRLSTSSSYNYSTFCYPSMGSLGQSESKITCLPVICHCGSILAYPLLAGHDDFEGGGYYRIGEHIYWFVATSSSATGYSINGLGFFLKVS